MQIQAFQNKRSVEYLDDILLKDGVMQVLPAETLLQIDNTDLRFWCHKHGVYGVPSLELIQLIKKELEPDKSIEVGGGCGVFGRALGIPSTDSKIQNMPEMKAYYDALGQPIVKYGDNVEMLEASAAIEKYKPDVVFGSWVTQYVSPLATTMPAGGGSVYGLRESEFMPKIKKYIIYGNESVHGEKVLFENPKYRVRKVFDHRIFYSRASKPGLNCLFIVTHV